jgi:hypothetical protein
MSKMLMSPSPVVLPPVGSGRELTGTVSRKSWGSLMVSPGATGSVPRSRKSLVWPPVPYSFGA